MGEVLKSIPRNPRRRHNWYSYSSLLYLKLCLLEIPKIVYNLLIRLISHFSLSYLIIQTHDDINKSKFGSGNTDVHPDGLTAGDALDADHIAPGKRWLLLGLREDTLTSYDDPSVALFPSFFTTPPQANPESLSAGAITAIVLGSLGLVGVIIACVIYLVKINMKINESSANPGSINICTCCNVYHKHDKSNRVHDHDDGIPVRNGSTPSEFHSIPPPTYPSEFHSKSPPIYPSEFHSKPPPYQEESGTWSNMEPHQTIINIVET